MLMNFFLLLSSPTLLLFDFLLILTLTCMTGFPVGSVVNHLPANAGDEVQSLDQEDPLEKEMVTPSSILA